MSERTGYPYDTAEAYRRGPLEETSKAAAQTAALGSKSMMERIAGALASRAMTPEELGALFAEQGQPALLTSIRARCTQLNRLGRVVPSGSFGKGESGKVRVIRWRLATEEELHLFNARKAVKAEKEGAE